MYNPEELKSSVKKFIANKYAGLEMKPLIHDASNAVPLSDEARKQLIEQTLNDKQPALYKPLTKQEFFKVIGANNNLRTGIIWDILEEAGYKIVKL